MKMSKLWLLSVAVFLLALWLDSNILPRRPPLVNYDLSEFFDPRKIELPESEDEIINVVKDALGNKHQVRVIGSGHSRNALAYSNDIIISLHHYRGMVSLDKDKLLVTVKGGTTLEELLLYLDENGLTLTVLSAILDQTVAGAISTATHGSRSESGNLATLVTKIKLVNGKGQVLTLSPSDDDTDLFKAAQVSLGLLGVITEVTFQVEHSFNLKETMEKRSLENCLQNLHGIMRQNEYVKLWLGIYSESCDIYRFERTAEEPSTTDGPWWINLKMYLWEPFLWLASWLPSLAPAIIQNSYGKVFYPEYTRVGKGFQMQTAPLYVPSNIQIEFAVAMEDCVPALRVIKAELEKWRPSSIFVEVRFVKADDIWLSMNYQRQGCHATMLIYNPSKQFVVDFFSSIRHSLHEFKPRFHFGKYVNISSKEISDIYPRVSDFLRVRSLMDPSRLFMNEMLEEMFFS